MAHFAQIDENGVVLNVTVVNNEDMLDVDGNEVEYLGVTICHATVDPDGTFIQTSYNGSFRKNYAGIGFTYDSARDAFIPPQPFDSWTLNEDTCQWEAPTPRPSGGGLYDWNEDNQTWDEV